MLLPWLLCGVLAAAALALWGKVRLLQKSLDEIVQGMEEQLAQDSNTLLSLSSRDRHARRLAAALNRQLWELRRQRRRYQQGDAELKEAITNISHDLRTPLTAICGYLELLEREETSQAVSRYLGFIDNRVQAMKQLTEELFRYSVILSSGAPLSRESVCVNGVLEESIAGFYGALTQRGITPDITMTPQRIQRRLDKGALSRVFSNLLNNALKYSGGDLSISLNDDGTIVFANTAAGLDPVQVGRLFDRFFTVEAARNSTGLGLSIAKALVEQMGGEIRAGYEGERLSISLCFPEDGNGGGASACHLPLDVL